MRLVYDTKRYAQLLLSVGVQGNTFAQKRPLTPIECAVLINRLAKEEKKTLSQISEMLGLGRPEATTNIYKKRDDTQARMFLRLLKCSEKSRYFAGWGWEGYPKIPFSTMALLSPLKPDDQDKIVQSSYNDDKKRVLIKDDVHKIIRWKRENPDLPIDEGIDKILKLKPVTVTTHIIVCEIHEKLGRFIKSHGDYSERLLNMLRTDMDGEFYSTATTDILITISMDETAYKTFHEQQYEKNVSFTRFLNGFLEDRIE